MVRRVVKRFNSINFKQNTIMTAAAVMSFMYGISAVLGFVKNRLLSSAFGDAAELGLYFGADKIPNLLLSVLTTGILTAAFIPVFNKEYRKNQKKAWEVASSVLNLALLVFIVVVSVVLVFATPLVQYLLAYGSKLSVDEVHLMANLMRYMMFAQLILVVGSFFSSVLHVFKRFVLAAMAPIFYNVGIIICVVFLSDGIGIYAPVYGMILGAMLHMMIQIPFVYRIGFTYKPNLKYNHKSIKRILKLSVPRTISQIAPHMGILVYSNLALSISATANILWNFANYLQLIPVRLFGLTISQAAFPILSDIYEEKGINEFRKLLVKTIYQVLYFVLPLSVVLFVLRVPLVRLAYGSKIFSWESTVMTSYTLAFFSTSIVFQSMVGVISRGFYALSDTKTPLYASAITLCINIILAVGFIKVFGFGVWGLSLSYTIATGINFLLLSSYMVKRLGNFNFEKMLVPVNKIGFASFLMGVSIYLPLRILDTLIFDTTRTINLILLTGIVSIAGFLVYLLLSIVLKIEELDTLKKGVRKVGRRFSLVSAS